MSTTTLQSTETARYVHVISEGVCVGPYDQANPGKSIYFDGTPLMNPGGTLNYNNVSVAIRYGTATQTYVPGFNDVENEIAINTEVKYAAPITHTTTSANVDAALVTVQFPNGLQKVDDNGNPAAETVSISFYTKLTTASSWTLARAEVITGVAESGYEAQYRLTRPSGAGTWDIQMVRVTPDTTTPNTVADKTVFYAVDEIQEVKLPYPYCSLAALTYDAKAVGNLQKTQFDWLGVMVALPDNYDPAARTYSGIWDGTMSATRTWTFNTDDDIWEDTVTGTLYWTDNPVWCLYDLMTNKRYGLGEFLGDYEIDLASFYEASKWCDEMVSDGQGGTEPRFTFNAQITTAEDEWKLLQNFAGTFNATLLVGNGFCTLSVDKPDTASFLVTRANMSSDGPTYTQTTSSSRKSVARISWNNPANAFQQEQAVYSEADPENGVPWIVDDATAWGCTSHGQALRIARWYVDSQLRNFRTIAFKAPLTSIGMTPGNIIKVADSRFAGIEMAAKIVNVAGTTVVLDRPVTVQTGTCTIDVLLADGTLGQQVITSPAGNTSVLTIASAFSQSVIIGSEAVISGDIQAQYFRIRDISEDDNGWINVTALEYDSTKYARVETGISVPAPVFSTTTANQQTPDIPTNIGMVLQAPTSTDGTITRAMTIKWNRPSNAATSILSWRRSGQVWTTVAGLDVSTFTIPNVAEDTYDIQIASVSSYGRQSSFVSVSYTVDLSGSTTPVIHPVTSLQAQGGGTTFTTPDLTVQWTNPATNLGLNPALQDFVVNVYKPDGTPLRQEIVDSVPAGSSQSYTYSYAKNQADNANVPLRSIRIDVLARDGLYNTAPAVSATFTNPAPAAIVPTATSGMQNNTVHMPIPSDVDFKGFILWGSTTSGFTPSSANRLYDGPADSFVHAGLSDSQTWYYKAAAYDAFGKDYTGAGLNVSAQISSTTNAGTSVNEYHLDGVTWTPNSPSSNKVAWSACAAIQTLGTGAGNMWSISAGNATWTSGVLYIYYVAGNTTLSTTTNIGTALASSNNVIVATYRGGTSLQVGDGNAYTDGSMIIAGTVGSTQVVTSGLITNSAQINNALITDAHFTGLLSAAKIDSRGLSIKDASGNVILAAGSSLDPSYVPSVALNSNVTINANGTLSGAGGGAVTPLGINAVGSGNQITAANASTFIANAAIGSAQVGTLTAANIDTRGLSIKDASGNIILAAGTPLTSANITPASGWLNSNVTLSASGVLSGAGGGTVTVSGLDNTIVRSANPITSTNVSTYIANAAIGSAQVGTLTASNIDTRGLTVKDASGNIILGSGTALSSSYAAPGTLNSAISISSSGVLSGAGGGTVTVAGLDNTIIRSANPITSGNVSTYISSLAVGTLQIGNNAITVPSYAFSGGAITVSSSIDAQTVTLTTSGSTVQIFGGASVSVGFGSYLVSGAGPYYDDCTWSASIYRDGSLLYTVGGLLCTAPYNSGAILTLPPLFDTPPAGGHTYTMRIAGSGSHNTFSASNRGLMVMEVKK